MAIVLLVIIIACTVGQKLFFKYAYQTSDDGSDPKLRLKNERYAAQKAAGRKAGN